MRRLSIFAKGNADVRDSLHALVEDGAVTWNGLNAALALSGDGVRTRVIHETMTRTDAVIALPHKGPAAEADFPLGVFPVATQGATRLFDGGHDAVVLSIQADVMHPLARHRRDDSLLYPHGLRGWPAEARRRLMTEYAPVPALSPEASMAGFAAIVARIRAARDVPVLIFNLSPVLGWERLHSFHGLGETLGERIRRFNLALFDLSRAKDVSIVDVEAIVARGGVTAMKRDAVTLTAAGCRAVALEVRHILDERGVLAPETMA